MRVAAHRFGEQRAVHVGVAARLEDKSLAQVIQALHGPGPLLEHRAAFRTRQAVDDEPQRLAGRVRVDGFNAMDHPATD